MSDRPDRKQPGTLALEARVLALAPDHPAAEIAVLVGRDRSRVAQILRAHVATAKPAVRASDGLPRRNPRRAVEDRGDPSPENPLPLAHLRRRRGLTQWELADAIGAPR